jgi:hypothetical protein
MSTEKLSGLRGRPLWVPAIMSLFFLLAALVFIPYPGFQNDELYFSGPIFSPDGTFYRFALAAWKIPVMVMSYSGALKTWLYAGLFSFLKPGIWSVRVPVALMGAGTIWLTWAWVRRIAGTRAAIIATVLLATDTLFLLTDVFDWGPVAIQHLLLMSGLVSIERWIATNSRRWLAFGAFLWGLGMWDKALLVWPLIGLSVGCVLTYPREALRRIRLPAAAIALAAFVLGMLPLVVYNVEKGGETATANAKLTTGEFAGKVEALRETINGSSLFGYMVGDGYGPARRIPRTPMERIAVAISGLFGPHRTNWMIFGWIAGLICFLALWGSPVWRPLLFLLVATAVTWLQMALTKGAGGASHHVILMWPLPLVFLGIAFAGIAQRFRSIGPPLVATAVGVLVIGNLLTTDEYLADFAVYGGVGGWTDAIYPLSNTLDERKLGWIGLVDWGCLTQLEMLHDGRLHLFTVDPSADAAEMRRTVSSPDFLFIQHTEDKEFFPDVDGRFQRAAKRQGYVERIERTIKDSTGRTVFELFRFQPAENPNAAQ